MNEISCGYLDENYYNFILLPSIGRYQLIKNHLIDIYKNVISPELQHVVLLNKTFSADLNQKSVWDAYSWWANWTILVHLLHLSKYKFHLRFKQYFYVLHTKHKLGIPVKNVPILNYWSKLPFPSPEDLPDAGIKPRSPALQADYFPYESPGKPDMLEEKCFSNINN